MVIDHEFTRTLRSPSRVNMPSNNTVDDLLEANKVKDRDMLD